LPKAVKILTRFQECPIQISSGTPGHDAGVSWVFLFLQPVVWILPQ